MITCYHIFFPENFTHCLQSHNQTHGSGIKRATSPHCVGEGMSCTYVNNHKKHTKNDIFIKTLETQKFSKIYCQAF
jgi:hypothetical protein